MVWLGIITAFIMFVLGLSENLIYVPWAVLLGVVTLIQWAVFGVFIGIAEDINAISKSAQKIDLADVADDIKALRKAVAVQANGE